MGERIGVPESSDGMCGADGWTVLNRERCTCDAPKTTSETPLDKTLLWHTQEGHTLRAVRGGAECSCGCTFTPTSEESRQALLAVVAAAARRQAIHATPTAAREILLSVLPVNERHGHCFCDGPDNPGLARHLDTCPARILQLFDAKMESRAMAAAEEALAAARQNPAANDVNTLREWHCPFCQYGEYKNRHDWKLRAARHLAHCEAIDPVVRADAAPMERIDNGNTYRFCDAVHGRMGRCVRGAGHNGPHAFVLPPYPQLPVMLGEKSL